jgi:cephalosporin hydroxylase
VPVADRLDRFVGTCRIPAMSDKLLPPNPTRSEKRTIQKFHQLYYASKTGGKPWMKTYWLGTQILKCPFDLWIYQEMLHELRPDVIIETGTFDGGSAHYMATLCDLLGNGRIITIDIKEKPNRPTHPRISYILGSSTDPDIVAKTKEAIAGAKTVLVILDSDHRRDHVLAELNAWADVVTPGSYCIVEDSNVNGHPVYKKYGPGPMEAIDLFMEKDERFTIDLTREKFFLTFNPRGFLRRVR